MHVLIVEHNPERWRAIQSALDGAGHRTEIVSSGGAALAALARPAPPSIVLIEERMGDMSAIDFLQAAARMTTAVPVVVLGDDENAARWVECTRLGALDFVVTDDDGAYLSTLGARLEGACERALGHDRTSRMADALASTAAPVMIADRSGTIEFMNDAGERLLGRKPREGRYGALADVFPLEDQPRVKADLFAAVHVGGEWAGEVEIAAEGGERVACMVTLSPVRRA
ncbi:MAG: response regulator, partial [Planctomycetota bacterium]|nr:response regulator [Planctomycetota bacterium]